MIEPLGTILAELLAELRKVDGAPDGNPTTGPILRGPSGKPLDLDNLAERVVKPTLRQCVVCKKLESKHEAAGTRKELLRGRLIP